MLIEMEWILEEYQQKIIWNSIENQSFHFATPQIKSVPGGYIHPWFIPPKGKLEEWMCTRFIRDFDSRVYGQPSCSFIIFDRRNESQDQWILDQM